MLAIAKRPARMLKNKMTMPKNKMRMLKNKTRRLTNLISIGSQVLPGGSMGLQSDQQGQRLVRPLSIHLALICSLTRVLLLLSWPQSVMY